LVSQPKNLKQFLKTQTRAIELASGDSIVIQQFGLRSNDETRSMYGTRLLDLMLCDDVTCESAPVDMGIGRGGFC